MKTTSSKQNLSRSATKQLASYAAVGAVGAVGMASQQADGAVIKNSGSIVGTIMTGVNEERWDVDLDGDMTVDVSFLLDPDGGFVYPQETGPYPILTATGGSTASVNQSIAGYGVYRYAQKFASSVGVVTSIGANASSGWNGTDSVRLRDRSGFANSRWLDPSEGVVGVRFTIGADTHLGFVEVSVSDPFAQGAGGTNTPVFGDYGYQDIADTSIPEPGSLGLLAAGALGLAAMRRRKPAAKTS